MDWQGRGSLEDYVLHWVLKAVGGAQEETQHDQWAFIQGLEVGYFV